MPTSSLSAKVTILVAAVTMAVLTIGFLVFSHLEAQNGTQSIRHFQVRLFVVAIGVTILLSVLLVFFLRRIVTKRILDLAKLAHRVSQGDLRARVKIDSPDEIGQLGRILNLMAEKLDKARSNLEKELEVQKEVDRLKDNFLAMVGHELRTPLTAVVGLSDAMLEGYAGGIKPPQRRLLQQIQEKGEHLSRIINNILDLERMQNGQMKMHFEEGSLETIVRHSISMVEIRAQKKEVELVNRFNLALAPMMMDKIKVQSVITNLLDNAIKFTPAGGKIEILARVIRDASEPDYVEILISDTGIGIPPPEQSRVFDRFYQVQQGLNRNYPGVGLGLPLARAFAQSHQGWLELKERAGWSATFSFGLPLERMESPHAMIDIRKSRCHLPSMLNGIIRMLEEERGEPLGIELEWPSDEAVEEIEVDKEYLRSILIIIFQNALRYRNRGTPVRVLVASSDEELIIAIENDGPPFSKEELKKIFDAPGPEGAGSKPQSPSFSLRTAVAILQAQGGRLSIEDYAKTTDGMQRGGVRFTLILPYQTRVTAMQGGRENGQKKDSDH